jgi:hypothetical protein
MTSIEVGSKDYNTFRVELEERLREQVGQAIEMQLLIRT